MAFVPSGTTRKAGIYAIRHTESGRVYVGSSVSLEQRGHQHERALARGDHDNRYLQAAWRKHGAGAFTFSVLEVVPRRADLIAREQHYIDALGAHRSRGGFNLSARAGSQLGLKMPESAKAKLAQVHTGTKATPETLARMSAAMKARWQDPEYRERMLAKRSERRGSKRPPAFGQHLASVLTGRKRTPEQRERIRQAQIGKTLSPEHRAKLSAAGMGRTCSEETRRKRSESMRRTLAAKRERGVAWR